jgi:hypothetical protein
MGAFAFYIVMSESPGLATQLAPDILAYRQRDGDV